MMWNQSEFLVRVVPASLNLRAALAKPSFKMSICLESWESLDDELVSRSTVVRQHLPEASTFDGVAFVDDVEVHLILRIVWTVVIGDVFMHLR
jgi:hypothetical protein